MKINLLYISLLFSFMCYTQTKKHTTIYLDEYKKETTKPYYDQKCKTHVLKCQKYQTKDITVYKINNKYKFGKLKATDYDQIRILLAADSKTKIENDKIIVIKYLDTLINYDKALENRKRHFKEHHNEEISKETYPKKDFDKKRQRYVKSKFKCVETYEKKYDTKIIHVYKHGDKAKKSYGNLNMLKDRGIIKHLFFKNLYESYILVLKPNGAYLKIGGHLSDKDLGKLITDENWNKYKQQLEVSINKKKTLGYGIFKKINGYHKKHCF